MSEMRHRLVTHGQGSFDDQLIEIELFMVALMVERRRDTVCS